MEHAFVGALASGLAHLTRHRAHDEGGAKPDLTAARFAGGEVDANVAEVERPAAVKAEVGAGRIEDSRLLGVGQRKFAHGRSVGTKTQSGPLFHSDS